MNLATLSQSEKNAMEFDKQLCFARVMRKKLRDVEFHRFLKTIRPDVAKHIDEVIKNRRKERR